MERKALARVIDTAENNDAIALKSLLVKKISKECLILFNADDSMRKTTQGKLLHPFSRQPLPEVPSKYVSLIDMWKFSPYNLMIKMRRHIVEQTTYDVITS